MADEELGFVALEVQPRAIGGLFDRHVSVDAERRDDSLEKLHDRLGGVGHMSRVR